MVKFQNNGSIIVQLGEKIAFPQSVLSVINEEKNIPQGFCDNNQNFKINKDNIKANNFIEY